MKFETEFIVSKGDVQYLNKVIAEKKEGLKPGKVIEKYISIFPDNRLISLEVTEGEEQVLVYPHLYQLTENMTHESCVSLMPRKSLDGNYEFIYDGISYVAKMTA